MHLADGTGYHWATAFQDCAEKLLGKTAQEMGELRDNNEDLFDYTIKSSLFKPYQLTLRSKMESYNVSILLARCIYPTGQNYSLELMYAKFVAAKNREKLDPLTFSSSGAICLKTTMKNGGVVKRVLFGWNYILQPLDYKACYH